MSILTVEDVHSYYDTAHILEGTSIHVEEGEVLVLLGRNGMGKTTLVRTIAGISPPEQRAGKVSFMDQDITSLESYEIARLGVGYCPQGRHVFGSLTVDENLEVIAREPRSAKGNWNAARVYEMFPRLNERRTSYARSLSGGEQQMLAIGRALMTNPSLMLMDEPSEGLAPIILGIIRDTLEGLKGELSILLVEQNLGLALALGDRINIMADHGHIVWEGTPDELRNSKELQTQYLGV